MFAGRDGLIKEARQADGNTYNAVLPKWQGRIPHIRFKATGLMEGSIAQHQDLRSSHAGTPVVDTAALHCLCSGSSIPDTQQHPLARHLHPSQGCSISRKVSRTELVTGIYL